MLLLKDKVVNKLARLFSGSPPSHPQHSPSTPRSEPQEAFYDSMEELLPPKKSTFSSFFLSFLPSTCSAFPRRWKTQSSSLKDKPLDCTMDNGTDTKCGIADEISKENIDPAPERNGNCSQGVEEASHKSREFLSCLTEKSLFVSEDLFEFLQSSLPNILKGCKWVLLYSTLKHGISLQTLIRSGAEVSGPSLLIVGDMQGAIFGGLLDGPLKTTPRRKYQGSSQTFVFTTIYGVPRLFKATGANRYYHMCVSNLLAFGGGSGFALCLEDDLLRGTSGPCETFGNDCLAHNPEFEMKNIELWGFTHASRYLAKE